jgi:2-polyprenyl-3-methyl-5-hydroxy-6-metoxy-1,4-benzoquinol methylase
MIPAHGACPGCGSRHTSVVGEIPAAVTFAGRTLAEPLPGGSLLLCLDCRLRFRDPRLSKAQLDALYLGGDSQTWSSTPATVRHDWRFAARAIEAHLHATGAVLDVGCFDGQFLAGLPRTLERRGIEIHAEAALRAGAAGVRIVGHDFAALEAEANRHDAVCAFDVLEHVENPADLLQRLLGAVRPGGIVVISTGNADAWSWRLLGARYWYCTIPEHIAFICPAWIERQSAACGATLLQLATFSHDPSSWAKALRETAVNVAYRVTPAAVRMARRVASSLSRVPTQALPDAPPRWITARDHLFAVLRRDPLTS